MRLVFNDGALADIANIHRWIDEDSPAAADRTINRLMASIETLLVFSGLGHVGLAPGTREWVVPRTPYVVVYEVKHISDELLILAVYHHAQDRPMKSD